MYKRQDIKYRNIRCTRFDSLGTRHFLGKTVHSGIYLLIHLYKLSLIHILLLPVLYLLFYKVGIRSKGFLSRRFDNLLKNEWLESGR